MSAKDLHGKIIKATKWTSFTEILARLITPISTIFLARLLSPEAFGILVTATMVVSFAEIFTDAGFQKYLIQHDFRDEDDLYKSTNVAFISNLILSIVFWIVIIIFSPLIAELAGSKGHGLVISISSICIPFAAFSSIQMALFKRHFDFKTLFLVRITGAAIPLVITIPLAYIFRSYWALVIGMIALNLSNAVILTLKSSWKPKLWYDWLTFKSMFSFTFWSMFESISIWLTVYADIFIVGKLLDDYFLGLYRTSMTTVGQITGIITAATTPVLFASLSRLQTKNEDFQKVFFNFQKIVGLLIIPLGTCIYIFRNTVTELLLGSQWMESAYFIGLWALTSSITIILSHYSSEIYRAKGKPKLSVLSQVTHLACLIPVVLWSIHYGFHFLCEWRSIIRLEGVLGDLIIMYAFVHINPFAMIKNILPCCFAAGMMLLASFFYVNQSGIGMQILYIVISIAIYLLCLMPFKKERYMLFNLKSLLKK